MGGLSWWHWAIFLIVALVLFGGKGKVSDLMGDVAKGIKSFKKGLADDPSEIATQTEKSLETAADAVKEKVKS
jgi:sec-independent protein translocase protein TatA